MHTAGGVRPDRQNFKPPLCAADMAMAGRTSQAADDRSLLTMSVNAKIAPCQSDTGLFSDLFRLTALRRQPCRRRCIRSDGAGGSKPEHQR